MTNQILEAYENLRQKLQAKEEENRRLREAAWKIIDAWDSIPDVMQALRQALEEDDA